MKLLPRKIELLLLEGTPFGLRYADMKNRSCRVFLTPRSSFKELLSREEMRRPGVYFLVSKNESQLPQIYIGEADVLAERLPHHQQKDFWSEIIVFTTNDDLLDKASVRYLESMLVQRALRDKQCDLQNGNSPAIKNLSEANIVVMDEFLEDIVFLLSVFGYNIIRSTYQEQEKKEPLLFVHASDQEATGRETDEGFIVYKDSTARKSEAKSWEMVGQRLRKVLLEKGVLVQHLNDPEKYIFTQDYVFSSPSAAAGMVLARSSNGRIDWKTQDGTTLKQLQEATLE